MQIVPRISSSPLVADGTPGHNAVSHAVVSPGNPHQTTHHTGFLIFVLNVSKLMNLYATILAGGSGTRFWPKSRAHFPKQFLVLQGTVSLLQMTVRRIMPLIPYERIQIVTAAHLCSPTISQLPELPPANVLSEPCGRNTAAAIGLAALHLVAQDPSAVMVVLPADHTIADEAAFRHSLQQAATIACTTQSLVTLGVRPTYAATGYGYIKIGEQVASVDAGTAHQVAQFVEKPGQDVAQQFLDSRQYLWNCGIFVWQASTILAEMALHLPQLHSGLQAYTTVLQQQATAAELAQRYASLQSISIDYGVLEKSTRVSVIPVDFLWNDVGSWHALAALHPADSAGNVILGQHLGQDTTNTIVYSPETLVATIGVDNLIVVCTDDVVLICPRERDQDVRTLVTLLQQRGQTHYL